MPMVFVRDLHQMRRRCRFADGRLPLESVNALLLLTRSREVASSPAGHASDRALGCFENSSSAVVLSAARRRQLMTRR